MFNQNWISLFFIAVCSLWSMTCLTGCQSNTVVIPQVDNTPPTVSMSLIAEDIIEVSEEIHWTTELDNFSILASGKDAGGVKEVIIELEADFTGYSGSQIHSANNLWQCVESNSASGVVGDSVSRLLLVNYDATPINISNILFQWYITLGVGCNPLVFHGRARAQAEDFHGNVSNWTPLLHFTIETSDVEMYETLELSYP